MGTISSDRSPAGELARSSRKNRGPAAAAANRAALIAAAREVYAESGLSAPFSAVARRAGVGQGSLYRHFPDRVSLAEAVFTENIDELERFASDPGRTLGDFLDLVVEQAVVSTAFIELFVESRSAAQSSSLGIRFREVLDAFVDRERTAGRLAVDVEPADVVLGVEMLALAITRAEPDQRIDVSRRARALLRSALMRGQPR